MGPPGVAISARDLRLLFQQSGNCCAFPECTKSLVSPLTPGDGAAPSSEVAHIVANSMEGPRGDFPLPVEERDRYQNLILLCEEHHHLIDAQPRTHTVERLRQIKYDHESMVAEAVRRAAGSSETTPVLKESAVCHGRRSVVADSTAAGATVIGEGAVGDGQCSKVVNRIGEFRGVTQ